MHAALVRRVHATHMRAHVRARTGVRWRCAQPSPLELQRQCVQQLGLVARPHELAMLACVCVCVAGAGGDADGVMQKRKD